MPFKDDSITNTSHINKTQKDYIYWKNYEDYFNLRIYEHPFSTGLTNQNQDELYPGQLLANRYQIVSHLDEAVFSHTYEAYDKENNEAVCLKVLKPRSDALTNSVEELKLLRYMNAHDPDNIKNIVQLKDYFFSAPNVVMVFELLKDNLYHAKPTSFMALLHLKSIAKQILIALEYIHSLGIMHCDLKPENIMIESFSRGTVKLIDFGVSCFISDNFTSYCQSRSYRAPEVILGNPYNEKIDMWSLGCILFELITGNELFPNYAIPRILARMIGILGPIPKNIILSGRHSNMYFTQDGYLYDYSSSNPNEVVLIKPLKSSLNVLLGENVDDDLVDLLSHLLDYSPSTRYSATEALKHPWFN